MTEQPRRVNGQFAEVARDEATVSLVPHIPVGSFLYPPILHDADTAILFWENEDIPDEVLHKCSSLYVAHWAATADYGAASLWEENLGPDWEAAHPAPTDPSRRAAWEAERERARDAFVPDLNEALRNRPEVLDPRDVRQAAKAIGLIGAAQTLPPEQAEIVRRHPIELTTGIHTVREVNLRLGLFDFGNALRYPGNYQSQGDAGRDERMAVAILTAVQAAVGSSQREILGEIGKVNDNVIKTAEIVVDTA